MIQPGYSNVDSEEDIAQRRKLAAALMGQASDTSPVGHWTQALARAVQGGMSQWSNQQAKSADAARKKALADALMGAEGFKSLGDADRAILAQNPQLMQSVAGKVFADRLNPNAGIERETATARLQALKQELAQNAELAPLKRRQIEAQIRNLESGADGAKVVEVDGNLVRVTRDGKSQVVYGSDPAARAVKQAEARKAQVAAAGIDPESPAAKAFIASGKMPREDQQPLTATDKKAILEADEAVVTGQGVLKNLDQAIDLSKKAYTGPTAGVRGYVSSLAGAEGGVATENLNNLITTNALQQLKALFGAAPTEGERKILLDIQGSVNKAPAVREEIYKRARAIAENRLNLARRQSEDIRGGDYFKAPKDRKAQPEATKRLKFNPATGELE